MSRRPVKWTPTALERAALRRINRKGLTHKFARDVRYNTETGVLTGILPGVERRTLTALFKKSLVEWGGPVYRGHVFVSRRGARALGKAAR